MVLCIHVEFIVVQSANVDYEVIRISRIATLMQLSVVRSTNLTWCKEQWCFVRGGHDIRGHQLPAIGFGRAKLRGVMQS